MGVRRGFQSVDEAVVALPFSFEHEDHVEILTGMAERLGPALGGTPGSPRPGRG